MHVYGGLVYAGTLHTLGTIIPIFQVRKLRLTKLGTELRFVNSSVQPLGLCFPTTACCHYAISSSVSTPTSNP